MNILVTGVGGDLGQSVIKCLKESDRECQIIGCDMDRYAAGQALCDHFFTAPPVVDENAYLDFMQEVIRRREVNYVIPMSDVEIRYIDNWRDKFEAFQTQLIMNPHHIIKTFMDKYETVKFFKSNGIDAPDTYLSNEYDGQLGFPVILKKQKGSGSQGLFLVKDEEELRFYLKRHSDMLVQQYLPGEDNEYTSCIFSDGDHHHVITFKRKLAPGGFSRQVELITDDVIDAFLNRLAGVLKFKGSLNVQFRKVEGKCYPFEINPRFSSTVYFRHRFGFKDVQWCLDILEGKKVTYKPLFKKGIGTRCFSETFFNME